VLSSLTSGKKEVLTKWKAWGKQYRQDMSDYEIYDNVLDVREHGAEWKDVYELVSGIIANNLEENELPKANTIEKAYKRVVERLKEQPFRYLLLRTYRKRQASGSYNYGLWDWIKETIRAGKPKGVKKTID